MSKLERLVLRGRAASEKMMVDACTVERPTDDVEGPGGVITQSKSQLYSGKCRITVRTRERMGGSWMQVGEAQIVLARIEVQLPIDAPEPREGDLITITTATLDPMMLGKVFTVRDVMMKSHLTARRVTVVEQSS